MAKPVTLPELIEFTKWRSSVGKPAQFITVPRGVFLQLIREQEARRRCASVLRKTHKEVKRLRRFNSWNLDKGGRWTNPNGSLALDEERRLLLSLLENYMNETTGFAALLSKETHIKIADAHIRRFENLLSSGGPNVRPGECQHYLSIWKPGRELLDKENFDPEDFSEDYLQELGEALCCGDYDEMLTPGEQAAITGFFGE